MADDSVGEGGYRPADLITSKLRFYSMGVVAENKALGSMEIEATPVEELTMLDGEVSGHEEDYRAQAQDSLGKTYDTTVQTRITVTATWLRFGDSNRLTAPDVRRGEAVMIYQFGDQDKYWWMTIKQDSDLRKLETVIWAISSSQGEGDSMDAEHTYYFEMSSHKKAVTLHTSKADGEPFAYTVQINAKEGAISIADDAGNYFVLNSTDTRIEMKNVDGSHFDMDKRKLTLTMPDEVEINTKKFQVNADTATLNAISDVTKTLKVMLATTLNGGMRVSTTGGADTESTNTVTGGLNVQGPVRFENAVSMMSTLAVTGFASFNGGHTGG